jgi:propanol-preferring alcohol dehydrogenase
MQAMLMRAARQRLQCAEIPDPQPGRNQALLEVCARAVCRTDLHVVDGELVEPKLPLVPGHEIVGRVIACGQEAGRFRSGLITG